LHRNYEQRRKPALNNKFAIPIRTNLHKTKDCYESNPKTNSGLDYTKSVVISRDDYIDTSRFPEIEHKEYNYIKFKEREIKLAFTKFVAKLTWRSVELF
jgi:hypothetical protein